MHIVLNWLWCVMHNGRQRCRHIHRTKFYPSANITCASKSAQSHFQHRKNIAIGNWFTEIIKIKDENLVVALLFPMLCVCVCVPVAYVNLRTFIAASWLLQIILFDLAFVPDCAVNIYIYETFCNGIGFAQSTKSVYVCMRIVFCPQKTYYCTLLKHKFGYNFTKCVCVCVSAACTIAVRTFPDESVQCLFREINGSESVLNIWKWCVCVRASGAHTANTETPSSTQQHAPDAFGPMCAPNESP